MYGLQQRKRSKSRANSVAPGLEPEHMSEEAAAEEAAKDDEYKLIYHQTYKGAALALVRAFSDQAFSCLTSHSANTSKPNLSIPIPIDCAM